MRFSSRGLKASKVRILLGIGVLCAGLSAAYADDAAAPDPFDKFSDPNAVVAAVQTTFAAEPGKSVRLSVYDSEDAFLRQAATKLVATLDDTGLAILPVRGLAPGDYAFVAYLDEDGDGKLKRGFVLGRPKEPVAFSNGVTPKLRKPTFDETKVTVAPGAVVVITLED